MTVRLKRAEVRVLLRNAAEKPLATAALRLRCGKNRTQITTQHRLRASDSQNRINQNSSIFHCNFRRTRLRHTAGSQVYCKMGNRARQRATGTSELAGECAWR